MTTSAGQLNLQLDGTLGPLVGLQPWQVSGALPVITPYASTPVTPAIDVQRPVTVQHIMGVSTLVPINAAGIVSHVLDLVQARPPTGWKGPRRFNSGLWTPATNPGVM